jgi:cytidine deaminase
MPVLLANLDGDTTQTSVAALLPGAFALPRR